jgi:putative transposase
MEDTLMKRRRHTPEQIVRKLREGDRLLSEGKDLTEVLRHLEVSESSWNRWRAQYGGMQASGAKRLRELEVENARLKKLLGVPIDDDVNASRNGWAPANRPARLRLVADTYGLDTPSRHDFLEILAASIARGGEFVRRRVDAGDPNFVKMWNDMGGNERFDRRRRWWAQHQNEFLNAVT